jgi:hypothetical protein
MNINDISLLYCSQTYIDPLKLHYQPQVDSKGHVYHAPYFGQSLLQQ